MSSHGRKPMPGKGDEPLLPGPLPGTGQRIPILPDLLHALLIRILHIDVRGIGKQLEAQQGRLPSGHLPDQVQLFHGHGLGVLPGNDPVPADIRQIHHYTSNRGMRRKICRYIPFSFHSSNS